MSRISVDSCPAGKWMDAAVAKALGWEDLHWKEVDRGLDHYELWGWWGKGPNGECYLGKYYSTDTAAAMELEPKMPYFKLIRRAASLWQCQSAFCGDWFDHLCSSCGCQFADGETIPLAISRAFLKAKGVKVIEIEEVLG